MARLPKKVMLEEDYEDGTTMWRVPCDCQQPQHDARLWFEIDQHGCASLRITTEIGFYRTGLWGNIRRRLVTAGRMLFTGYCTMDGEVCLQEDGINGLRYALDEGKKAMAKAQKEFEQQRKLGQAA